MNGKVKVKEQNLPFMKVKSKKVKIQKKINLSFMEAAVTLRIGLGH